MLRCCNRLLEYHVQAEDGIVGELFDFYFDEQTMRILYAVVRTGRGVTARGVLISPLTLGTPHRDDRVIPIPLGSSELQNAPDWNTCKPVYRQNGPQLNYPEPKFRRSITDVKILELPLVASPFELGKRSNRDEDKQRNPMRSVKEVCGYVLCGPDGNLAEIRDFVVADKDWTMPYILLSADDTSLSRILMIHTSCVTRISWAEQKVHCDISRKLLAACPYFAPEFSAGNASQFSVK